MSYTEYFDYTAGATCYTKPRPLTTGNWGGDAVQCSETASTGEFQTGALADNTQYAIYEQAGALPAASDKKIGRIDPTSDQVSDILNTTNIINTVTTATNTEVGKIPRPAAAVAAGDPVKWQMTTFTDKDNVVVRYQN